MLAFKKGDEITILRKQCEEGAQWWEGSLRGSTGRCH